MEYFSKIASSTFPTAVVEISPEEIGNKLKDFETVRICPERNLISISTHTGGLLVLRFSGEKAWSTNPPKKSIRFRNMQSIWRPDGKLISIYHPTGACLLHDGSEGSTLVPAHINLRSYIINWVQTSSPSSSLNKQVQGWIDLTRGLPKLSTNGTNESQNARLAIHGLIQSSRFADWSLGNPNLLVLGNVAGFISFNLYGLFSLGNISLSKQINNVFTPIFHSASMDLTNHIIIAESKLAVNNGKEHENESEVVENENGISIFYISINTNFIKESVTLPQIALTSSKIMALLSYINDSLESLKENAFLPYSKRVLSLLADEVKKTDDYTSNIFNGNGNGKENENENDDNDGDISAGVLYDLLVTGISTPEINDWLANTITERGLKKWNKTSTVRFETLRKIIFENIIPAIERLIILLSQLSSNYSSYLINNNNNNNNSNNNHQNNNNNNNNNNHQNNNQNNDINFLKCLEISSILLKNLYKCIWFINNEFNLFSKFIEWLSYTFEETINSSDIIDEFNYEKAIVLSINETSDYISNYLGKKTILEEMICDIEPDEHYDLTLNSNENSSSTTNLLLLFRGLDETWSSNLKKLNLDWQNQVVVGDSFYICEKGEMEKFFMKEDKNGDREIFLASKKSQTMFEIFKINPSSNLKSSIRIDILNLTIKQLNENNLKIDSIIQFEFINEIEFLILVNTTFIKSRKNLIPGRVLLSLDYSKLQYNSQKQSFEVTKVRIFDSKFIPKQMAIGCKKGKEIACLIDDDMRHFEIINLINENDDESKNEIGKDDIEKVNEVENK